MNVFKIIVALMAAVVVHGQSNFVEKSNNGLTATVFAKVNARDQTNLVFSPMSILIGFGMLFEGLDGVTRTNFGSALGFPRDERVFRRGFEKSIPENEATNTAAYANLVTVAESANINSDFAKAISTTFQGNPFKHPFEEKPKAAENSINTWVSRRSNGKIRDLLPPGSVSSDTKVVLVNVIYFKGNWKQPFSDTSRAPFNLDQRSGRQVNVDMMTGDLEIGYRNDPSGGQMVALPFDDDVHDMVLVLPPQGQSLNSFLTRLAAILPTVSNPQQFERAQATITLPKFKASGGMKLKDVFGSERGIGDVFGDRADFSRMANDPRGFKVDEVYHRAVIDVNEKGVEATGATGIVISVKSFFSPDVRVDFNRPFAYFIVDKVRNTILFAGRMDDPTL